MKQAGGVLRPVDDEARRQARRLIRAARHGSLATLLPDGAAPLASRVLVASDPAGHPLLLVSDLSAHAGALRAHPACSILFGEVGTGDPLAYPRISVFGRAEPLEAEDRAAARERFLARHPSAEIYCDFADFRFLRVVLAGAGLNAGFARAYEMSAADLVDDLRPDLAERLARAVAHMNADHAEAVDAIAARHGGAEGEGWRIVTADRSGFEVARGDALRRVFFAEPLEGVDAIRPAFAKLAREA
jgi:heme iron utilization protein